MSIFVHFVSAGVLFNGVFFPVSFLKFIKILYQFINFSIVIRNGNILWKHGRYCWYFRLNLKFLGWPYRAYIKTEKNGGFCEELLSEIDFEAVLATFCCHYLLILTSEALQKIAADQKDYHRCSSFVTLLNSQNIPINQ